MGTRATGVQRFASEIVRRLWTAVEDGVLLLPRGVAPPADLPEGVAVLGGRMAGHAWERIELTRLGRRTGCDVLLHLANTLPGGGGPHVVVVHDVEPLVRQEAFTASFVAWYRWVVAPAVRRAARVVTVSRASARAIAEVVGVDPERIRVADQGAAPLDAPADVAAVAAVRGRFALGGAYLLAVGGDDPRKNVAFLRVVMERWLLRRARGDALAPAPMLVVVHGGAASIFAGVADATVEPASGELRLARMDDASLRALYTGAAALAFPSLSEGFGRPAARGDGVWDAGGGGVLCCGSRGPWRRSRTPSARTGRLGRRARWHSRRDPCGGDPSPRARPYAGRGALVGRGR